MSIFSAIGGFFKNLFTKAGSLLKKLWEIASPFVKEVLSEAAAKIWESAKEILIEVLTQIATKGLPTDDAKRDAFEDAMKAKLGAEWEELKDYEKNTLREMALSIVKKTTSEDTQ